jgi:hypothetical protein
MRLSDFLDALRHVRSSINELVREMKFEQWRERPALMLFFMEHDLDCQVYGNVPTSCTSNIDLTKIPRQMDNVIKRSISTADILV